MKNVVLIFSLVMSGFFAFCQTPNHTLHFDGVNDAMSILITTIPIIPAGTDFTTELWFFSENNTMCNTLPKSLLIGVNNLAQREFEISTCGSELYFNGTSIGTFNPTVWNHISMVYNHNLNDVSVYLNGTIIPTSSVVINTDILQVVLGAKIDNTTEFWKGKIDDFRVWKVAKTATEILSTMNCPCTGSEEEITICMPFDQGNAGGVNTGLIIVHDLAPLPIISSSPVFHNGQLFDFDLIGLTSNFVISDAPLVYPAYRDIHLSTNKYFGQDGSQICSGDAMHFCLSKSGGGIPNIIPTDPNIQVNVLWEYLDNTVTSFTPIPAFSGLCFPVGQGEIVMDCSSNPDGYQERDFRAVFEVIDTLTGHVCNYYSDTVTVRICCPLSDAVVNVTTNLTNDLLCAGDNVIFDVGLSTPDIFLNPPGAGISIEWTYNGDTINQNGQISFTHQVNPLIGPQACFEATVTSCAGKVMKYKTCLNVDLIPRCGEITENPTGTLMQLTAVPLVYEICPGDDASLKMVNASNFQNGNFVWQYSFPNTVPGVWHDLGTNNTIQNTNILPVINPPTSPYLWPIGGTCIVYRIEGRPYNSPSGCDSCHTNELTICLKTPPVNDVIIGSNKFCKGNSTTLSLANYDANFQHLWYWNGTFAGSGPSISANKAGCYWVVISNGCESVTTPPHCVEVCEIQAVLSCPLAPNTCPNAGDMITLSACDSESNCTDSLSFSFQWSNNSGAGVINGCQLSHNVQAGGTTYTVTVTDSNGCSDTASLTVIPCN